MKKELYKVGMGEGAWKGAGETQGVWVVRDNDWALTSLGPN